MYYEAKDGTEPAVYRAGIPEGTGQKLCDRCRLLAVSADEKIVLSTPSKPSGAIVLRRLDNGAVTDLLPHEASSGGSFQFSPDGRWLAFHQVTDYYRGRILIAPVRSNPVPSNEWIEVADGANMNRNPAWPPQGQLLYFRSDRDGRDCVWAHRLDARTKRPVGQPFEVYHYDALPPWDPANLTVTADKILLRRTKLTSGLWTGKLP